MIYEKKDTTALITINRPKALNAFNSRMLDELTEALEMAEKDTGVRCVILTAAGERAFTAGGDIKEEVQLNETFYYRKISEVREIEWILYCSY